MSSRSKKVFPSSTANAFHVDGDYRIVASTHEHASYVQQRLRIHDARECMIHGITPWRALHIPLKNPDAQTWTFMHKDVPLAMGGVVEIFYDDSVRCGSIWMLGSYDVNKHKRKFFEISEKMLEYVMLHYDYVENVVPVDHTHTLLYLNRLGFMFAEEPTLVNGFTCVRFVRCNSDIEVRFE